MGTYRVVAPCSYVSDGAAHVHSRAGAFVELDDATAAELGDAVRNIDTYDAPDAGVNFVEPIAVSTETENHADHVHVDVDDKPKAKPKRRSGIDGPTGAVIDDDLPILQSETAEAPADGQ